MSQPKILYSRQDDGSIAIRTEQHGKNEAAKQIIVNAVEEALKGIEYRTIYVNSGVKPRIILTTNPTYNSVQIMDRFRDIPGIFEERTGEAVQELDGLLHGVSVGGSRKSNKSSKKKKYRTTKNKKNKKSTKGKKTKKNKKTRR